MQPAEFITTVRDGLAARGYDRHLTVALDDDRLTIEFRWLGTTRFEYRLDERPRGFRAELVGQRIAPLHTGFSDRFDRYFAQALAELGATPV